MSRRFSASKNTNAKYPYLLSGLLYCGECGCKMHGNHRKHGNNDYNTYRCNKTTNQLTCNSKEIRADVIEQFVLDNFFQFFFANGVAERITEQVNKTIQLTLQGNNQEATMARNALQGLRIVQKNLVDAIANTGYNQTLADKLTNTEKQIQEYEAIVEADKQQRSQKQVSVEDVKKQISMLKVYFKNPENIEQTKIILHNYIQKVVISNEKIKVIFKVAFPMDVNGNEVEFAYNSVHTENRPLLEAPKQQRMSS